MNNSEILIYQNSEGNIKIDVRLEEESVWLSQSQMAELFGKGRNYSGLSASKRQPNWSIAE